ncbi:hypothetical protein CKAH01_05412 [Colletotrichum kahawae]|uniref:Uncharacterized protein n=1 Tax=Colletotrichum kahawae TaxID=34407 RepID=A0AAD9YEN6_COLKA|nr:hypothetical protein CKAH01_05412 [Colletotrichum kahawae]
MEEEVVRLDEVAGSEEVVSTEEEVVRLEEVVALEDVVGTEEEVVRLDEVTGSEEVVEPEGVVRAEEEVVRLDEVAGSEEVVEPEEDVRTEDEVERSEEVELAEELVKVEELEELVEVSVVPGMVMVVETKLPWTSRTATASPNLLLNTILTSWMGAKTSAGMSRVCSEKSPGIWKDEVNPYKTLVMPLRNPDDRDEGSGGSSGLHDC